MQPLSLTLYDIIIVSLSSTVFVVSRRRRCCCSGDGGAPKRASTSMMVIKSKAFVIAMMDESMFNFKYCIIVLFSFRYINSNVFLEIDESRRRYLVFLCVCFL